MIDSPRPASGYPIKDLDLVIWDHDYRYCRPDSLYLVLEDAGDGLKLVHPIDVSMMGAVIHKGIAQPAELIPISAFGLVAEPITGRILKLRPTDDFPKRVTTAGGWRRIWHRHPGMPFLDFETAPHPDLHELLVRATAKKVPA